MVVGQGADQLEPPVDGIVTGRRAWRRSERTGAAPFVVGVTADGAGARPGRPARIGPARGPRRRSMRVTVGVKLGFGFLVVVLLFFLITANTYYASRDAGSSFEVLFERGSLDTERIASIRLRMQQSHTALFQHVASVDSARKATLERLITELDQELEAQFDEADEMWEEPDERIDKARAAKEAWETYHSVVEDEILPASRSLPRGEVYDLVVARSQPLFDVAIQGVSELMSMHVARIEDVKQQAASELEQAQRVGIAGGMLGALLALTIAVFVSRDVSGRLRVLAEGARQIADRQAYRPIQVHGDDEIGELARAFNHTAEQLAERLAEQRRQTDELQRTLEQYGSFVARLGQGDLVARLEHEESGVLGQFGKNLDDMSRALRQMTLRIHEAVKQMSDSTAEILATSQQHVSSATESASAVTETVATVEQLRQVAGSTADRSREVATGARRGVTVATVGQEAVNRTIAAMDDTRREMTELGERIRSLAEQSQAIERIIDTVNELAERSNILALNAAIEAARAGEHGRGFAVVAQEIGSLAEQSKRATTDVRSILGEVQRSTGRAVVVADDSARAVSVAVEAVTQAGGAIDDLAKTMASNADSAQRVLDATEQQAQATKQISEAMSSIRQASQLSVDASHTTERAAQVLAGLSVRLREAADYYRV
ncbi:MAG: methyl-accepting chemotaxis protein [Myxococcota bacterium]